MAALVPAGISLLLTFTSCHSIHPLPQSPHMRTDIAAIVTRRALGFYQLQLKCLHSSFTPDCVHTHTHTYACAEN